MEWIEGLLTAPVVMLAQWLATASVAAIQFAVFMRDRRRLMARRLDVHRNGALMCVRFQPVQAAAIHRCSVRAMSGNLVVSSREVPYAELAALNGRVPPPMRRLDVALYLMAGEIRGNVFVYSLDGQPSKARVTMHCPHSWRPITLDTRPHQRPRQ